MSWIVVAVIVWLGFGVGVEFKISGRVWVIDRVRVGHYITWRTIPAFPPAIRRSVQLSGTSAVAEGRLLPMDAYVVLWEEPGVAAEAAEPRASPRRPHATRYDRRL